MKIEILVGSTIDRACEEACALAKQHQCDVEFDFNGIQLSAGPDTVAEYLAQHYMNVSAERHKAYLASPDYKAAQQKREREDAERKIKLTDLLSTAPDVLTLKDPYSWKKACDANTDGYGAAVMSYADWWARLMEVEAAKGKKVADVAEELSHLANTEGITGFMHSCAKSILSQVWIYGDDLQELK